MSPSIEEIDKIYNSSTNKKFKSIKTYTILGKEALDEIHFDQFFLNGKLGFPNPMHTGMIFGWSQLLRNFIIIK